MMMHNYEYWKDESSSDLNHIFIIIPFMYMVRESLILRDANADSVGGQ